jgi:NAD(P)-dependent dehydrogenase (short-subunit alcohol dehydrogenase family)
VKDLNGKNVVVTGGSCEIGLELAKAFLKDGANVFTIARNRLERLIGKSRRNKKPWAW